jgi:cytochrome c6
VQTLDEVPSHYGHLCLAVIVAVYSIQPTPIPPDLDTVSSGVSNVLIFVHCSHHSCISSFGRETTLLLRVSPLYVVQAAAAGAFAFGVAVGPANAGNVDNGEQIFNANCAACHAGGQNVIMPEKTLEKEALESYLAGGRNEKSVITQVTNGKNAMPAFGGRLDDEAIADVAAYVIATSEAGWD